MTLIVFDTASIGESSDVASLTSTRRAPTDIHRTFVDVPPSPARIRSYGIAKNTKDREPFYKGYGVVYLTGAINITFISRRVLCR